MKKMTLKTILTLAALALLLTFTVSGTLAYISTSTGDVENVFTPVRVDTEIVEAISNNEKTSITVYNKNESDLIPVYVRVHVTGNWCDSEGNIVLPWEGSVKLNTTDWDDGGDGYFYYKKVLPVGETTENLLAENISSVNTATKYDGLHLEITVAHQSIQSTPTSVVDDMWGVTVAADGTISK